MVKKSSEDTINPDLPPSKAIELFKRQIDKISQLLEKSRKDPEAREFRNFNVNLITRTFGKPSQNLSSYYSAEHPGPMRIGMSDREWEALHKEGLQHISGLFKGFIDQLEVFGDNEKAQGETQIKKTLSRKVFIVHGHDESAKNEIEIFLKENHLEPIVLHRQTDGGNTLIEKIEKYSDVAYAIVIITPDDTVIGSGPSVSKISSQEGRARQNVIFEWGYFLGKYGRERVCCVYKQGVVLPSDLSGLVYKPFQHSIEEVKYSLLKELQAVGLV